ncbi:MAG: hypothetical protein HC824_11320 [Synechococcales cyanobacterium RM1_1_8]|nr:hypothetical protein [Synechococcales cyanobacterium RM1_1_8]
MTQSRLSPELQQLIEQWREEHGLEGLLLLSAAVEKLRTEAKAQPKP